MKKLIAVVPLAFLMILVSFSSKTSRDFPGPTPKDTLLNELSASEKSKGWKLLFDGKTLDGWRMYKDRKSDSWKVEDGMLHSLPRKADKTDLRADVMTAEIYDDFELSIDWKIAPQANSGILYMVQETESSSHLTGPEYQIIDDLNFPEKLADWQKTGANYALHPAPTAAPKPVGEWNNTLIRVKGKEVEHWLNGKRIVKYTLYNDKWKKAVAASKFKDAPHYAEIKKGHIALQDHGGEAWFRNIKIRTF